MHPKTQSLARQRRWQRIGLLAAAAMLAGASGCATSRGVLDIRQPSLANPATGPAIKIVEVRDQRKFEVAPNQPSIPSLKDRDIGNKPLRSRAIARKRNTYGAALGDILLPEGRTVEQLTREALTAGLREGGIRVVEPGDVDYDSAVPFEADIEKFWSWFTPGFWAITLEFQSEVRVSSAVAGLSPTAVTLHGAASDSGQAATGGAWQKVMNAGLADLVRDCREQPSPVVPAVVAQARAPQHAVAEASALAP
ncbi:MAG TPA: flagellar biosynthesis protein [Candidatus Binatia bacterium]|nr:flagellar biosynthesis protein [Candidatus Binatia bacterium]